MPGAENPRPPSRRLLLRAVAAGVPGLALLPASRAWAQPGYPERPVRIVVPFAPGGGVDIVARLLAEPMRAALSPGGAVPLVIENRGGAGGQLGAQAVAKAAPDGYTILLASAGEIAAAPALYGVNLPYDPIQDLIPITLVVRVPNLLVVASTVPARSAAELIELARRQPGALSYASSGVGNLQHLNGALFNSLARVDTVHVPYRGTGSTLADVAAGRVSMTYAGAPALLPLIRDGKLRPLGVTSRTRIPGLPDIPALSETPALSSYELVNWYGLFAPAGTPAPALERLHAAATQALRHSDLIRKLAEQGAEAAPMPADEFRAFVSAESTKLARLIREAEIRPEN
ncbi:tripartite tricarboxylate transporter substrate binding protein [Roseomonas sp. SG15]|uniref:Tripartite tricarboxylate transporter substrate binding protein n=2 Tax=Roseomonas indoligenes TaxID=2820811 RepID=A0A940S6H3_9PROT|nr:tripartite tricarboxylate transporter substrate-binding protein [Pararoseomonas indoligenes]MBP0495521.1 tripartite tricarboxylate transporter substrate binding protein [Pararoseomonas indoligenes]